jgi:hypothetical protein
MARYLFIVSFQHQEVYGVLRVDCRTTRRSMSSWIGVASIVGRLQSPVPSNAATPTAGSTSELTTSFGVSPWQS